MTAIPVTVSVTVRKRAMIPRGEDQEGGDFGVSGPSPGIFMAVSPAVSGRVPGERIPEHLRGVGGSGSQELVAVRLRHHQHLAKSRRSAWMGIFYRDFGRGSSRTGGSF